jgi:DNA polymerase I
MYYPLSLSAFDEIVYCDTEFHAPPGERPIPICLVLYEHQAKRITRYWLWERVPPRPPAILYRHKILFVAYLATAEFSVFQALGWPLPKYVLDLYIEVRNLTSGLRPQTFIGLHEAARVWRVPYIDKEHKDRMRDIAIQGGPAVLENKGALLYYCQDDTRVLAPLLQAIVPKISLPHALIRGEFSRASALIEQRGLPVNLEGYRLILEHRESLRRYVADRTNQALGPVFEDDSLSDRGFANFVTSLGLTKVWPKTPTGKYKKDIEDTLEVMGHRFPEVEKLRQAMKTLNDLKSISLALGEDGRNRYLGGLFGTITSRNNPLHGKEVLLLRARWWRNLIQPAPGWALAYLDYSSEEFMVQAVLANDPQGIADYLSGDVYVAWGKAVGLIPPDGDKKSHARVRALLKDIVLGLNYGMGLRRLANDLGIGLEIAGQLLQSYRERYKRMVEYGEVTIARGVSRRQLRTRLDWRLHIGEIIPNKQEFEGKKKPANVLTPNSIRNFPVQSNAAEILRLAVILASERGVTIIATLHDALLIEAPVDEIEAQVALARRAMEEASATVLINKATGVRYPLRVSDTIIRYPDHFREGESAGWWEQLRMMLKHLSGIDIEKTGKPAWLTEVAS